MIINIIHILIVIIITYAKLPSQWFTAHDYISISHYPSKYYHHKHYYHYYHHYYFYYIIPLYEKLSAEETMSIHLSHIRREY